MNEAKHVHVIGIGGSAMAPLAGMLRESGYRVTGSDSVPAGFDAARKPGNFVLQHV